MPGDYIARARAASFKGLPPDTPHHKMLLEPIREAGALRPFDHTALVLLELLVDFTRASDWKEGADPVAYPSNGTLARSLGKSQATISRKLRELRQAGVIDIRYGVGNRRTPMRDADGKPVAFGDDQISGISLAPLPAFAAEMAALILEVRRHQEAVKDRYRAGHLALDAIIEAQEAMTSFMAEMGDVGSTGDGPEHETDRKELARIAGEARRIADALFDDCLLVLAPHLPRQEPGEQRRMDRRIISAGEELDRLRTEAISIIDRLFRPVRLLEDSDLMSPLVTDDKHNTTSLTPSESCNALQEGEGRGDTATPPPGSFSPKPLRRSRMAPPRITAGRLMQLSPRLAEYCALYGVDSASLDTRRLILAAETLALEMGLSASAHQAGTAAHGPLQMALMTLVACEKPAEEIRTSRAALLAGMIKRAPDEVRPLPSLFAFMDRRGARQAQGEAV